MNLQDIAVVHLTFFAWREGERLAPGSLDAKKAIAHVVRNRVDAGWENGDWLKIIMNTDVSSSSLVEDVDWKSYIDLWSYDFKALYGHCEAVYSGLINDALTTGADLRQVQIMTRSYQAQKAFFYAALGDAKLRPWFLENIVRKPEEHPRTVTVGTITFFG
jgi:hypothetical protein